MEGVFLLAGRALAEVGFDGPVFLGDEGLDLALALHDEAHGHALHAPGGEAAPDLLPEEGREAVADQAVEHAAGLLGVDEVHVDLARVGYGGLYRAGGDLVELDAVDTAGCRSPAPVDFAHVPGYGLALAVGVGGQVDGLGGLHALAQVLDGLALVAGHDVLGREAVLGVDAQGGLGQVADVAHAGLDGEVAPQIFFDGPGLGRRLDYYQVGGAARYRCAAR